MRPLPTSLLLLTLLLATHLALVYAPNVTAPGAPPLPTGVQVYFTTPTADAHHPPALVTALVADVDRARRSVDLAMFDLDEPLLTAALVRASDRGVAVQAVLDSFNLDAPEMAHAAGQLQLAGALVTFDQREPFMHHKVIVVDDRIVWTGSWNATDNDTYRNDNNMLRITDSVLAARYRTDLAAMHAGRFDASKATETIDTTIGTLSTAAYFSPGGGADARLVALIEAAQTRVAVMAFSFTSAPVAEALIAAYGRGVRVEVIMEARNARGSGSVFGVLRGGGVSVTEDGNCFVMHHKVMIIDSSTVVTGSYNFSKSAEESNVENMLVLASPALAHTYLTEFARIATVATTPSRC